jgi:hypothetical protein
VILPEFFPTSFLLPVLPDAILKWVATFVNKKLQEKMVFRFWFFVVFGFWFFFVVKRRRPGIPDLTPRSPLWRPEGYVEQPPRLLK